MPKLVQITPCMQIIVLLSHFTVTKTHWQLELPLRLVSQHFFFFLSKGDCPHFYYPKWNIVVYRVQGRKTWRNSIRARKDNKRKITGFSCNRNSTPPCIWPSINRSRKHKNNPSTIAKALLTSICWAKPKEHQLSFVFLKPCTFILPVFSS